jgi:hypothetical protein
VWRVDCGLHGTAVCPASRTALRKGVGKQESARARALGEGSGLAQLAAGGAAPSAHLCRSRS